MIQVYYENKEFAPQIEYTFKMVGNCCGQKVKFIEDIHSLETQKDRQAVSIIYGKKRYSLYQSIHILEGPLFQNKIYLTKNSSPQIPLYRYKGIPILFKGSSSMEDDFIIEAGHICMNLDVIQSTFFLLTDYEEIIMGEEVHLDSHERFQSRLLIREKYIDRPLINEYAKILCDMGMQIGIDTIWNLPPGIFYHVSHDVDYPYEICLGDRIQIALFNRIILPLKEKNSKGSKKINEIEIENNIVSSWYIKGGGTTKNDHKYLLNNQEILDFFEQIKKRGCELGYHYSYAAFNDVSKAAQEAYYVKEKLNLEYLCGRNHFLKYKIPDSWRIYEQIGLVYDATQGCAEYEGFTRGICIPYKLFDLFENRVLNVWEIPLIVMDGTLRQENYRNYMPEDAFRKIMYLIQTVREFSGVFSILWHNTSITGKYWETWFEQVYKPIMRYIGSEKNSSLTGMDIIDKYKING